MNFSVICKTILMMTIMLALNVNAYALTITSPHNGDTFREGDVVHFVAELTPSDTRVASVALVVYSIPAPNCRQELRTHPKYECDFTIPLGSPRVIKLGANLVSSLGMIKAPGIAINVALSQAAVLQSLKAVGGNTIFLSVLTGLGAMEQLHIMGKYSDGQDRDLWLGSTGTTYMSSNPNIVTINKDGLVTAVANGKAQITVTNGGKKLIVTAIVGPTR